MVGEYGGRICTHQPILRKFFVLFSKVFFFPKFKIDTTSDLLNYLMIIDLCLTLKLFHDYEQDNSEPQPSETQEMHECVWLRRDMTEITL